MRPLLTLLIACSEEKAREPVVRASPDTLPLSAYEPVALDLSESGVAPEEVLSASLGGVAAYGLVAEGDTLTVTAQGAPEPGPVDLVLRTADGEQVFAAVLRYEAPVDPLLDRVWVVGASLGMGVQSAVPTAHGQLHGPAAFFARQSGAWVPPPVLIEGLFEGIAPDDVGEPPGCALPDLGAASTSAAAGAIGLLRDPESGDFSYAAGREDPAIEVRNLAVGGSGVCDVARGPGDFGETFLSHLVYEPSGELGDPVSASQLQLALAGAPTLVLSFDLMGNDLIDMVIGDTLDPALATPEEDLRACLEELLALADGGAELFLANTPDVNVLPVGQQTAARLVAEGAMTGEEIVAAQAEIRARVLAANALLDEAAAGRERVHVIDVFSAVEALVADGVVVGDQTLSTRPLGGLLSLDGLHFSDVGYALLAQAALDELEAELGLALPAVDLAAALAGDPWSPDALRAAGLDPSACE